MAVPKTKYISSDGVHVAYQVVGDGPPDVVFVLPSFSHLDLDWDAPDGYAFGRRLASFSRLIRVDRRGTGLSDRTAELPTLEEEAGDLLAVLDAVGSHRPYLVGVGQGGSFALFFAAAHPARCAGVVAWAPPARVLKSDDYPFGWDQVAYEWWVNAVADGTLGQAAFQALNPSLDAAWLHYSERYVASAVSPGAAARALRAQADTDIRAVLPLVQVPVLVLHRGGGDMFPVAQSRDVADRIPGAAFRQLAGADWNITSGDQDAPLDEIEEFVTGVRPGPPTSRVFATVLITDIVGSTACLTAVGDRRWREMIERHDRITATEIERFAGRRVNTTGDGVVATFDGPARAIRCAESLRQRIGELGIRIRAGMHAGEVDLRVSGDISGVAVHLASRVASLADADEVLVSRAVVDLVAGSGITFADHGEYELEGVPGRWQIFRVHTE